MIISAVANWIAYKCFGTTASISIASIITMIFWYVIVEVHLEKNYAVNCAQSTLYLILMMALFYMFSGIENFWLGFLGYAFSFTSVTVAIFHKDLSKIIQEKRNKKRL